MKRNRFTVERQKARKHTPSQGMKRVHADRKLREQKGYRKHKGAWTDDR